MWIELTDMREKKIIFNVDDISTIQEYHYAYPNLNRRLITMKNRNEFSVINTYDDIVEKLKGCIYVDSHNG